MDEKKPKTRIATKKALAKFAEKFSLDESIISNMLGKTYLQKMEKKYCSIDGFITFKFKTLSDTETTSNEDMAAFIKSYLDGKINGCVLMCRNYEEYKGLTDFLAILPAIKNDILENGETLLSKYPPVSKYALDLLEKRYHETEEFWKKDKITDAMVLSPAIREFGKIGKMIHCYTQKDGDVLITLDKYNWNGNDYSKAKKTPKIEIKDISVEIVDSKDNSGSGCLVVFLFIIALLTFGLKASAQVENLDELSLIGRWFVESRSGEFDAFGIGTEKPYLLSFSDGNFTLVRYSSEKMAYYKGYWVTKSGTNNYFLHMMPWDNDMPIVNFRIRKFYRGELELETYDGKNWLNCFNEHGASIRSVSADSVAASRAYRLNGIPATDNDKGIIIKDGKKTVQK